MDNSVNSYRMILRPQISQCLTQCQIWSKYLINIYKRKDRRKERRKKRRKGEREEGRKTLVHVYGYSFTDRQDCL